MRVEIQTRPTQSSSFLVIKPLSFFHIFYFFIFIFPIPVFLFYQPVCDFKNSVFIRSDLFKIFSLLQKVLSKRVFPGSVIIFCVESLFSTCNLNLDQFGFLRGVCFLVKFRLIFVFWGSNCFFSLELL